jgi:uncharacterized protein (UPF0332 family)
MRLEFVTCQDIGQDNAPFVFEQIYEVMRECGQSLMIFDGYKAENSHEAVIAFVNEFYNKDFGEKLIADFDRYRVMRHNSIYNVSNISPEATKKALVIAGEFTKITSGCIKLKKHGI